MTGSHAAASEAKNSDRTDRHSAPGKVRRPGAPRSGEDLLLPAGLLLAPLILTAAAALSTSVTSSQVCEMFEAPLLRIPAISLGVLSGFFLLRALVSAWSYGRSRQSLLWSLGYTALLSGTAIAWAVTTASALNSCSTG